MAVTPSIRVQPSVHFQLDSGTPLEPLNLSPANELLAINTKYPNLENELASAAKAVQETEGTGKWSGLKWYEKAANQGHANAQCNLGFMYEHGRGVEKKNERTAADWYKKAADQGFARAKKLLDSIH